MLNISTSTTKQSTWAEIKAAVEAGTIKELLNSGDTIPVMLTNGECVTLDVAYDAEDKIYFVLHDCLHDRHAMNVEAVNSGAWADSAMREYLNTDIFALLPDELKAVISPCTIIQVVDGEEVECEDNLFCLSATQVFGGENEAEPEDKQLDIFATERDRVKMCGNSTGWYWLRTAGDNNDFKNVGNSGNENTNLADAEAGVVFAFTV